MDEITYQALHDGLTGLANRMQFTARLRAAVAQAPSQADPVTLFYIDLDAFKPVNDEFGHEIGDELLTAVGKRLKASTRERDVVARLGGDEFAVLIDAHAQDTDVIANRLATAFGPQFAVGGHRLTLGASIGRAAYPTDTHSAESLLRLADAAMFEAKRERYTAEQLVRSR